MRRLALLLLPALWAACYPPGKETNDHNKNQDSAALLSAGPMLGYSEMREVALWVQTKEPARVQIRYWIKGQPAEVHFTDQIETSRQEACTAHLVANQVEPGRVYEYALEINGQNVARPYPLEFKTRPLWEWRGQPPEFSIAIGSCNYVNEAAYDRPGKPYGSDYEIFTALHGQRPDLMLWLGDNVYLREADWSSRTGILARYTHDRALPELQPLLASTHHYAIWDDHDFGANDADSSNPFAPLTYEAFKLFWSNPSYDLHGKPAVCQHFEWGDVDVILLDDRTFRSSEYRVSGERHLLGTEQIEWAIDRLKAAEIRLRGAKYPHPRFKILAMGGQWLSNNPKNAETFTKFPEEYHYFMKRLEEEKIGGVVLVSGDVHRSEINRVERPGLYPLTDITTSSLTAGLSPSTEGGSTLVPGTILNQHNAAVFCFSGPLEDRKLTVKMIGPRGELLNATAGSRTEVDSRWILSANKLQAPILGKP